MASLLGEIVATLGPSTLEGHEATHTIFKSLFLSGDDFGVCLSDSEKFLASTKGVFLRDARSSIESRLFRGQVPGWYDT